jgi:hypothetical protein
LTWFHSLVTLGVFPNVLSKFVLAFGLQAATDPFLILIIDATMPSVRWKATRDGRGLGWKEGGLGGWREAVEVGGGKGIRNQRGVGEAVQDREEGYICP